jgi:hypothetical protein
MRNGIFAGSTREQRRTRDLQRQTTIGACVSKSAPRVERRHGLLPFGTLFLQLGEAARCDKQTYCCRRGLEYTLEDIDKPSIFDCWLDGYSQSYSQGMLPGFRRAVELEHAGSVDQHADPVAPARTAVDEKPMATRLLPPSVTITFRRRMWIALYVSSIQVK